MPLWWSEPTSSHAYILSLVSIVITLIAAVVGIIGYAQLEDSLILIYGLENIVDFFSSAIVLWRFNDKPTKASSTTEDVVNDYEVEQQRQRNEVLSKREKRASIGVSIILAVLGFGGLITAVEDLVRGKGAVKESDVMTIFFISSVSFVVFGILAKFKFHYANELNSPSLRKDGICSGLGAVLSLSMFFNSLLAMASEEQFWWWLDPTVALFCGLGALGYGLYGMYKAYVKDGYPIFSCKFWLYGAESRSRNQSIGGAGELELQQSNQQHPGPSQSASGDSIEANASSGTQSGISLMQTRSGDELSDVVFT